MSETKRGAQAPRSPRKRTRSKRAESDQVSSEPIVEADAVAIEDDAMMEAEAPARTSSDSSDRNPQSQEADLQSTSSETDLENLEDSDDRYDTRRESRDDRDRGGSRNEDSDYDEDRRPQSSTQRQEPGPARQEAGPKFKPSEEYLTQIHFDRSARQFVGTVHEFPEIRIVGTTKAQVLADLDRKVEQQISHLRSKGTNTPQPIATRKYPEKLELPISQALYRKLDVLSRQEKTAIEGLVAEMLAGAVEKRFEAPPSQKQHSHGHSHQDRDRHHDNRHSHGSHQGGRSHNSNQGGGSPGNSRRPQNNNNRRGGQGRNYHDTMDNRENFLEYVRSLEKDGGAPNRNRWKK